MTTLLAFQYLPTALIPAWATANPSARLITELVAIAVGSAMAVELLLWARHSDQPSFDSAIRDKASLRLPTHARRLSLAAIIVTVLAALTGLGSYGAGIGALANSPIASFITPFRPWMIIAATLHLVSWKAGHASRNNALKWLGILLGVELAYTATTAIIAPLVASVACVLAMCALLGFIRPGWTVALILIGVLAWPAVADLRNVVRVQQGGAVYGSEYDPGDRLRLDLIMQPLSGLSSGVDLGQPGPVEILRYGLIPRALDTDRPPITTGRQLNVLIGGTTTSSYTFTLVGNIWLMRGPLGLGLYCAVVAFFLSSMVARKPGPWGLAMIALGFQYLVWVGASYPDSLVGFVQAMVSLGVARAFVHISTLRNESSAAGTRSPGGTLPSKGTKRAHYLRRRAVLGQQPDAPSAEGGQPWAGGRPSTGARPER